MFDGPQRAIGCATAIRDAVRSLGIEVRAGLHTGECKVRGDDIGGIAVHIGARVSALAGANDVLVSSTLRDLVIGSGLQFEERGAHGLKGCPASGISSGGNEPARTWFEAMKPIATDFGDVHLPPTDPLYVEGAPGGRVPSVSGLDVDAARQCLEDAGLQVADQPTSVNSSASYGTVVGTTPSGQTFPGSIITINVSNGIAPAPPPPPVELTALAEIPH